MRSSVCMWQQLAAVRRLDAYLDDLPLGPGREEVADEEGVMASLLNSSQMLSEGRVTLVLIVVVATTADAVVEVSSSEDIVSLRAYRTIQLD